jgi:hypothetical protein
MKITLFDLGDTLEYQDQNKDVLMPGTIELLSAAKDMRDHKGDTPSLARVSDFDEPAENYYALLQTGYIRLLDNGHISLTSQGREHCNNPDEAF